MVRIPVYDSPQVGYQPVNLPQASTPGQQMVMGNAPQAMAESGQAISQAGQALFSAGTQMQITERYEENMRQRQAAINERIKNERAELQAVSTLNLYQETSTNIRDDYELLDGVNAMDSYPATMRKLEDARKAAEESLKDNPIALQMFAMRADRVDAGTRARFARHHDKSVKAATLGNHAASIEFNTKAMYDSAMAMGIEDLSFDPKTGEPQGFVAEYTQAMINVESSLNTIHKAKGLTPAQAKVERDELYSKLNARIVDDLLSTGQEPKALKYFQLSESTIQDPKVRERVSELVTKKRRADYLNTLDVDIRRVADLPQTEDVEVDGILYPITVPHRFEERARAFVDALQADGKLSMQEAESFRARYASEQNQRDEADAKRKAQVLSEAQEFAAQVAGTGADANTLAARNPSLFVRAQREGVTGQVLKLIEENGDPVTDSVGRGLLNRTTEELRSIKSEEELRQLSIGHLSQADIDKLRNRWEDAVGKTKPVSATQAVVSTLLQQYYNDPRNASAFVPEDLSYIKDPALRDAGVKRNAEKENRKASFELWLRSTAQEIAGPDRAVTEDHYRQAMLRSMDSDRFVQVKRNFRGSTVEEISIIPEAMSFDDAKVARYAISPFAKQMWEAAGLPLDQLVEFAKNTDTIAYAMQDFERGNVYGPLQSSVEYELAEKQHVTRQLLEQHAKRMYEIALTNQASESERAQQSADQLLEQIAKNPDQLKAYNFLESEYYRKTTAEIAEIAEMIVGGYSKRDDEYAKKKVGVYRPVMEYYRLKAKAKAAPAVKPGLKLEEGQ